MRRRVGLLLSILLLPVPLVAGCVDEAGPFEGADLVLRGGVDAGHAKEAASSFRYDLPPGRPTPWFKAVYEFNATFEFAFGSPGALSRREIVAPGPHRSEGDRFGFKDPPRAGTQEFVVTTPGHGSFAIGVYFCARRDPRPECPR